MKLRKKLLATLLVGSMIFGLYGCAGQSSDSASDSTQTTDSEESAKEASTESSQEPIAVGDAYRDFTISLLDGTSFTLSEHKGSVILLNFWATWCGPCVGEMPAFTGLQKKYGDKLTLIAVNKQEDTSVVEQFIEDKGFTFPIGLDPDSTAASQYPTDGIPYTVIIDKEGNVAHIQTGAYDADRMYQLYSEQIDPLL